MFNELLISHISGCDGRGELPVSVGEVLERTAVKPGLSLLPVVVCN